MLRQKPELNIIYISERMRHSLQPVARSSLTAVVAPMGYGKTTAINWYLNERGREGAAVLRVSIYSANRAIFWKSLQKAFAQAGPWRSAGSGSVIPGWRLFRLHSSGRRISAPPCPGKFRPPALPAAGSPRCFRLSKTGR